jgi:hypothetical protein
MRITFLKTLLKKKWVGKNRHSIFLTVERLWCRAAPKPLRNAYSLFFFFFLLAGGLSAQAIPDTLKTPADCAKVALEIANQFKLKAPLAAKDLLEEYWLLNQAVVDDVWSQSAAQYIPFIITNKYGGGVQTKQIKSKEIPGLFVAYSIAISYEKHFLRIQVTFYQANPTVPFWGISGFQCDDLSDLLFENE